MYGVLVLVVNGRILVDEQCPARLLLQLAGGQFGMPVDRVVHTTVERDDRACQDPESPSIQGPLVDGDDYYNEKPRRT